MQCWLICKVGYIAPTSPPLTHGMHNTNIFRGFHGNINRYVKYVQKISIISSHYEGARLLYINEKQNRNICIYLCVCSRVRINNKIQQ